MIVNDACATLFERYKIKWRNENCKLEQVALTKLSRHDKALR